MIITMKIRDSDGNRNLVAGEIVAPLAAISRRCLSTSGFQASFEVLRKSWSHFRLRFMSIALILTFASLLTSTSALAQSDAGRPRYTDADWALLPEWCIDTQDGPYGSPGWGETPVGRSRSPRSDKWTAIFGRDFWHMHHFCRALHAERQAGMPGKSAKAKVAALGKALGDYQYIIDNCAAAMPLMPEVLYRLGETYLQLGDLPNAGEAFAASRRLKPDYWPAYTRWADELVALGLIDRAQELIEVGLRHSPTEVKLLERKHHLQSRASKPRATQAMPSRGPESASSVRMDRNPP